MNKELREALDVLKLHYKFIGPLNKENKDGRFDAVYVQNAEDADRALQNGYADGDIFCIDCSREELPKLIGKCRLIASSSEELRRIDAAAQNAESGGKLIRVGLRLTLDEADGANCFKPSDLERISKEAKGLKNISLGGVFIRGSLKGSCGRDLGCFMRSCYETAKLATVILPCSMPYIGMENLLEALEEQQTHAPRQLPDFIKEAQTVGMQNATAFYAKLLIS
ncbi:hypothetical protein IJT93_09850 [bacterium]|nr:hypothetical protein [bacterium]